MKTLSNLGALTVRFPAGVSRPGALAHGAAHPSAAEPLLCNQRLQRPVPATLRVCYQVVILFSM
jgi:hypothetical protein